MSILINTKSINSRLARRLSMYVILASTSIAIFSSALQIYVEFQRDLKNVRAGLAQIEQTHLSSIASRVWVLDSKELKTTLNNLLGLPSMQYVAVYDNETVYMTAGTNTEKNVVVRSYPLTYEHNKKIIPIGKLIVKASLDEIYQHTIDRAIIIFTSNAVKTFIIAGLILLIFYKLVAQHLCKIAQFTEQLNIETLDKSFEFDRKKNSYEHLDELDILKFGLTKMQQNLAIATRDLKEREQNLAITLNSIGDAVITTDARGMITRMNPAAEKLTGWCAEETIGIEISIVFPIINADTREAIQNPIKKVITNGDTVFLNSNTTLTAKDGTEYQIADSAAPIRDGDNYILGMVLVFNDVSEEYKLRETAAKNKRDLQAIMDHSPASIYVKDNEGCYTFINQQFSTLHKIQRKNIIGKTDHDVFPHELANESQLTDRAVLTAEHPLESEEFIHQDDGLHSYVSTKFPLFNTKGEIYAVCGISNDITERKHQEEQLRRSKKMDALGKLTGGIAHDYNNLLGIIIGYTELLNEFLTHDSKLAKYSHEIQYAAERGAKLTKKLLAFSQLKTPDASVLNINQLLLNQQFMLEKTLTVRIKLLYELEDDLWPVELDGSDLEDAIINMCINSLHAMESGGQLTIQTRNENLNAFDVQSMHLELGDFVLLSITDTGCGMDKTTKEKLFDPFYSTKGEHGTGLGLSQVYGFVERSGGTITVYSEPGHGSRFTLYFPRSHQGITKTKISTVDAKLDLRGNETLLVVDDEQAMAQLAHDILSAQGYRVLAANDGIQALAILEKETVNLMISDIIMPNMDGYQLAEKVKQQYPHIKILIVSGFADDRHNELPDDTLHKNILYKPYASSTLLSRVRSLLGPCKINDNHADCTIMVMDDEENVRELFSLNLEKLGYKTVKACNGDEAISLYQQLLKSSNPINAVIMDLSIPGSIDGSEVAKIIRNLDPDAKLIVSSGDSGGPVMTHYQDYGFQGALEKNFDQKIIKQVLEEILS